METSNTTTHKHYAICKPYGFISQFISNEQKKKKNHKFLGELADFPDGTMAIGRLDRDSEGLLLLTTDGKKSYFILSSKVEKEYHVQVDGIVTNEAIEKLKQGVVITVDGADYTTKPCKVTAIVKDTYYLYAQKKYVMNVMDLPVGFLLRYEKENSGKFVK